MKHTKLNRAWKFLQLQLDETVSRNDSSNVAIFTWLINNGDVFLIELTTWCGFLSSPPAGPLSQAQSTGESLSRDGWFNNKFCLGKKFSGQKPGSESNVVWKVRRNLGLNQRHRIVKPIGSTALYRLSQIPIYKNRWFIGELSTSSL